MLYKVRGKAIEKVNQTKFKEEEKLERDLEDWIENNPSIIGERLLIFGRQVQIRRTLSKVVRKINRITNKVLFCPIFFLFSGQIYK